MDSLYDEPRSAPKPLSFDDVIISSLTIFSIFIFIIHSILVSMQINT